MNDTVSKKQHTLSLQNREKLDITGVSDVPAFNSDKITARNENSPQKGFFKRVFS